MHKQTFLVVLALFNCSNLKTSSFQPYCDSEVEYYSPRTREKCQRIGEFAQTLYELLSQPSSLHKKESKIVSRSPMLNPDQTDPAKKYFKSVSFYLPRCDARALDYNFVVYAATEEHAQNKPIWTNDSPLATTDFVNPTIERVFSKIKNYQSAVKILPVENIIYGLLAKTIKVHDGKLTIVENSPENVRLADKNEIYE